MRRLIGRIIGVILRASLSLRYRVQLKGLKDINKNLRRSGGILFLPNHPALIDPVILMTRLWPKWQVRAMMVEYMYYVPGLHWLSKSILKVVPVPSFEKSSNTHKVVRSRIATEEIKEGLRRGENYIIYPSGKLKRTPDERVGGASLVHELLNEVPEANVVLIRTTGLWGSRFGWGLTGSSPNLTTAWSHAKMLLRKNLFFWVPRRTVKIEAEVAPDEFHQQVSKVECNRWLEAWYNQDPPPLQTVGEPTHLVSYNRWRPQFPAVTYTSLKRAFDSDIEHIPMDIRRQVTKELVRLSHRKPSDIRPDMHLLTDLGLDSLDMADLFTGIERIQGSVGSLRSAHVLTVAAAMQMAAGEFKVEEEEFEIEPVSGWKESGSRPEAGDLAGETLFQVLLDSCSRMGDYIACADDRSGVVTYRQLKIRALALSQAIRKMPGKHIGILLPSSVAVHIVVLACWLAGKVPALLNWTIGPRYLEAVKDRADIDVVLSSWVFLDRLDGVDLTPIHDMFITLEKIRHDLSFTDKLWAKKMAKKSTGELLKALKLDQIRGSDDAVLLLTSGTEALPKAVPLTHENLLSNQRAAVSTINIYPNDIFYGILPPFHSLGFSIAGIVPLLLGGKVIYSPDPTDAPQMVRDIACYRPTIICSAPTFLTALLAVGRSEQLSSLRLYIAGAEKAPYELFESVHEISSVAEIIEGYGITECSPVLTLNRPGEPRKGVGKPLLGVELQIIHPDTHEHLETNQVGLILASGPNIFPGYLGHETSPFIEIDGRQWYNTGDLGSLDEEGRLTLAGRLKRFVKVGGEMISLPAIEDALYELAAKQRWGDDHGTLLAVVAVENPGERPQVILFANVFVELDDVNESLRQAGLGPLSRITAFSHLPEIPLMGSGKCNYPALQQMADEMVGVHS